MNVQGLEKILDIHGVPYESNPLHNYVFEWCCRALERHGKNPVDYKQPFYEKMVDAKCCTILSDVNMQLSNGTPTSKVEFYLEYFAPTPKYVLSLPKKLRGNYYVNKG